MQLRPWPALLLTGLCLTICASAANSSVLGLKPLPPDPPQRFANEKLETLLRRAQEIESQLAPMPADERFHSSLELIDLYDATAMPKHRHTALEICEQLRRAQPDRIEPVLAEARIRAAMSLLLPTIDFLRSFEEQHRDDPRFQYALGYYYFERARGLAEHDRFRAARRHFLRAARLDRGERRYRLALAAAAFMVKDAKGVLVATKTDGAGEQAILPALLLRAGALHMDGRDEAAHYTFQAAFSRMLPDWRELFETGGPFLDPSGADSEQARKFWIQVDPHPTQVANGRQVEFWVRLVEADVLFGSLETWTPGWTTQPGGAWARWGRPSAAIFEPSDPMYAAAAPSRPGPASRNPDPPKIAIPRDMRAPPPSMTDTNPRYHRWHWHYALGEQSFSLTFVDTGYRYDWSHSNISDAVRAHVEQSSPLLFVETRRGPRFAFEVAAAGFVTGEDESRLELALGLLPQPESGEEHGGEPPGDAHSDYRVDWAVFRSDGRRIDNGSVELTAEHRRSLLLRRVDPSAAALEEEDDPLLAQISLILTADRYHIAIEAYQRATEEYQSVQLALDLGRRSTDELALSDLQITDTYLPWDGTLEVPGAFVKYAHVLVPRPSRRFVEGHRETYVYYEVSGLQRDESGNANFDVVYELEPLRIDLELEDDETRRAQVQRQEFLGEITGISPGGKVIKGTRVDLGGLTAGPWLLRVVVRDLADRHEVYRELEIQVEGLAQ